MARRHEVQRLHESSARGDDEIGRRFIACTITVTVPADAAPGDRVVAGRTSLPIRLRVGGALTPSLAVEHVKLDGDAVTYTLHNAGNAILGGRAAVTVSSPFGRKAANQTAAELLPGERRKLTGRVHVTRVVRLTAKVSVAPLLTDAAGSTAPLPAVSSAGRAWAIPWLVVLPLAAVHVVRRARTSAPPRSRRDG